MNHRYGDWDEFQKFDLVRFPSDSSNPPHYQEFHARAYLLIFCLAFVPLARHYVPIFLGWYEPPFLIKDDTTPMDLRIRFIIEPHIRTTLKVLILVNSLPHHFKIRQRIRESWAMKDLYDEESTKVMFFIGKPRSQEEEELLAIEEGRYHDVIVTEIEEDYYSLSIKTYAMLLYKDTRFRSAKCMVKADSDNVLIVRNYEVLCDETIGKCDISRKVKRDRTKWMVPESIYPYPEFPKYCSSGTYTLCGHDVPAKLLAVVGESWFPHSANYRKLPEDVLFTGIFAEIAGIRRTHVGGMSFIDAPDYICRNGLRTYSLHMNRARNPSNYFKRLTAMEEAKSTLKPFIHGYWKSFEERNFDKVMEFFHPDAIIVEVGIKGTYGKEAIKKQLLEYDDHMGKTTMKVVQDHDYHFIMPEYSQVLDEHYQMTEDYIIFGGRYEIQTEKAGVVKGKLKAIEFYHPHAVLVERGKRGFYGKEEIKKHLLEYDKHRGGTSMKSWNDEHYQMTEDYITVDGHYKTETEKVGNMDGEFHMIWKKSNGKYLIKRNEFDER
ncbi:unnamed protein product [Cylicocyclus nassatus]|uniref:Hexosyltransferase n=1 Tax=Cylicocyclus nassatus TaxID=53992 RepID=A0AA36MCI0_CYLNA|nr:unnamed protein product [Cylicocyclus nassatus]